MAEPAVLTVRIVEARKQRDDAIFQRDAALKNVQRLNAIIARDSEALLACEAYFDNKADAGVEGDPPMENPNTEMRLLNLVRVALGDGDGDDLIIREPRP